LAKHIDLNNQELLKISLLKRSVLTVLK